MAKKAAPPEPETELVLVNDLLDSGTPMLVNIPAGATEVLFHRQPFTRLAKKNSDGHAVFKKKS